MASVSGTDYSFFVYSADEFYGIQGVSSPSFSVQFFYLVDRGHATFSLDLNMIASKRFYGFVAINA